METLYPQLSDEHFVMFSELLYKTSGIAMKPHKKYLMLHRLSKFVGAGKRYPDFPAYYNALKQDASGKLLVEFVNVLTTNFTFFFREKVHFDFLRDYLKTNADSQEYIRIWSAACSTGEEPYSIGITAIQALHDVEKRDIRVLATDISKQVLAAADNAMYHYTKIRGHIDEKELRLYFNFDKDSNDFIVKPHIKNLITFRYLNLMEDYPFNKLFDVVFLRNVLIYFENNEKEIIINKITEHIKPGGYLILGLSESMVGLKHSLTVTKNSIYQKSGRSK